jgi:photosystem II stability/assembly factor-like uncharacterized protein
MRIGQGRTTVLSYYDGATDSENEGVAVTTSKAKRAQARREAAERTQRERRRNVTLLAVAVLVLLAVVGFAVVNGGPGEEDLAAPRAVERLEGHIHGLAAPTWSGHVHVATHNGLVRRDDDGTWVRVSSQAHDFMGFSGHPTNEGVFYSSGHPAPGSGKPNPLGFMVSTDGGRTWEIRSLRQAADFHAMAVQPTDGDVVYGWNGFGRAGLYRSTDAGENWDVQEVDAFTHPLTLAVHPEDADAIWAGTEQGLLASDDAGRNWRVVLPGAPVTAVAFDVTAPDRVLAYASGHGLVESADGGRNWEPVGFVLDGDAVGHLVIDAEDGEHVYAATMGQDILESHDGGRTWQALAREGQLLGPEGE